MTPSDKQVTPSASIRGVFEFLWGGVSGRAAAASLAVERLLPAIALDVHLEDRGVMNEAVDRGERHRLVGKNPSPFAERLIGRDERRAPFVARRDQFEQDAGLGLILGDIGDVVEDEQVVAIELGDCVLQRSPPESTPVARQVLGLGEAREFLRHFDGEIELQLDQTPGHEGAEVIPPHELLVWRIEVFERLAAQTPSERPPDVVGEVPD